MLKQFHANQARLRRHQRIRSHLTGTEIRPRLNIFRSGAQIYAQVIDDTTGKTLAAASSLDESLKDFKPAATARVEKKAEVEEDVVELAASAAPTKGKGAKAAPAKAAAKTSAKGAAQPQQKGRPAPQIKTVLPTAQKGAAKTQAEALAAIADNRKVALAREVGKLLGSRAKEQGVTKVVFDRGGYAYHGRVAALAEGARETGLDF